MQRATRTNLFLLVLAGLLGFIVYWQIGREKAGFEPPLGNLDAALVQRVSANCLGCTMRRFERRNGQWWMVEPYALPANAAMVERLIGILASPVRSRRPLQELDASKIGLDPPLMQLEIDDQPFDIGMTDALLGDRYVRTGDVVAMMPDRFSPFLMAAAESELDRHLVPRGSTLASLRINGVDRPDLIEAWAGALAEGITASASASASTANDFIDMQLDDGSTINYQIVRKGDAIVTRRGEPPLSYTLSPEQETRLLDNVESSAH